MTREEFIEKYVIDILSVDVCTKYGDVILHIPKESFCSIESSYEGNEVTKWENHLNL